MHVTFLKINLMKLKNNKSLKIIVYIALITISSNLYSQNFGIGACAIYNFQTESFGAGLRAEIPVKKLIVVPQISYYPGFNQIQEYYAGVSLHFNIVSYGNLTFYTLINGAYNGWINYESSSLSTAKYSNWAAEGGIGIKKGKCWKPFMELRYNVKWKEANLRIGLMYFFNCDSKNGRSKKKKKAVSCPAYAN
jgi:hypothetical protein